MPEHGNAGINKNMARHPLGRAERLDGGRVRLGFVRDYAHPRTRVWRALTDPAETEKWWARSRGSLRAGSSFDLKWLNAKDEGHGTEMDWWNGKVLACEPPRAGIRIWTTCRKPWRVDPSTGRTGGMIYIRRGSRSMPSTWRRPEQDLPR